MPGIGIGPLVIGSGGVQGDGYAVSTGTNIYAAALPTTLTSLTTGTTVAVLISNANTSSGSLNVDSTGAKPIVKLGNVPLDERDLVAGMIYIFVYDGTNWQTDINTGIVLTPSDQTTTVATIGQAGNFISGLSLFLQANSVYYFRGYLKIGCNNTGGVKFAVGTPGSATVFINFFGSTTNNTTFGSFNAIAADTLIATAFCQENQSARGVQVNGAITTTNSGSVYFKFAAGVAGQTASIFEEGSFIVVNKIS